MLKKEWKSLFQNKILLLVVIAVIMIPVIYAGLFLKSMWDPYGEVSHLPVAVVNKDKPVEYEGTTLNVGEELIENLEENDSLAFHFVDSRVAEEGLEKGIYYMVITIPEEFSANAATLMDETPSKMVLQYETNPGTNYIASKLSESALVKIRDAVASQVTETYAQTVFDQIAQAGDGMQEAADGAGKLKDGLTDASDGSKSLADNLKVLASSTLTFKNGAETLTNGLKDYTDGVARVDDGAKQLRDGVKTLTGKVPELTEGVTQLNGGLKDYTDGVARLNQNSQPLKEGADSLASGSEALRQGTQALSSGAEKYISGADILAGSTTAYVAGASKLAEGAKRLSGLENLSEVSSAVSQLNTAVSVGSSSTPALKDGTMQLETGLGALYEQLTALTAGAQSGKEAVSGENAESAENTGNGDAVISDALAQIGDMVSRHDDEVAGALESADSQIASAVSLMSQAAEELGEIQAGADENGMISADSLDSLVSGLSDSADSLTGGNAASVTGLSPSVDEILENISGMQGGKQASVNTASSGDVLSSMKILVQQLYEGAKQVNTGTQAVAGALETLDERTAAFPEAAQGMKELNAGFAALSANNDTLTEGASELKAAGTELSEKLPGLLSGADTLAGGAKTLSEGVKAYTAGAAALDSGSAALTNGGRKLAEGAAALADGAGTLENGTDTLYQGTQKLMENNGALNDGARQLTDGATQIQSGASQLYEGSRELDDGMKQLEDGSAVLSESLAEGAEEMNSIHADDDMIEMFAAPVEDSEIRMTEVENNGHAMAPYMMSVGLWVGALAFCLMYPLTEYRGKLKSGFAWWAGKASVLYPVAVLQGVLLIGLLHVLDGFTPVEMTKTVLFACLTAMTFTSIMYFFNVALGKIGSFLMLIFMVVQLAGSAGTYPVELSPSFVARIHAYVPFTYTVNAFRSTICGGTSIAESVKVLTLLFCIFTGLTILQFHLMAKKKKENKETVHDWLEAKGLA